MMDRKWRVVVVGAGSIGGWAAAKLALAGHEVAALGRNGPLDSIRLFEGESSDFVEFQQPHTPPDLVIIAVKGPAMEAAAQIARPMIGSDTLVLPMINGVPWWFVGATPLQSVDPSGSIAESIPQDRVIGCVIHAACLRTAPAEVRVKFVDGLIFGEPGGGFSDRAASLTHLFASSGIPTEQRDSIRQAIWYKLWGNATVNPLSALTRATMDRLVADPQLRALMTRGMEELSAVGAAIGCPIAQTTEDRMAITARLGAFKTSMLQDVEAGRPFELEALLGAPREIARREGIATPTLDVLYAQTRLLGESLNLL